MVQGVVESLTVVGLRKRNIIHVHELSKIFRLCELIVLLLLDDWHHKYSIIHFGILIEA